MKRNPIAKALRSPLFKKRVIKSKKTYNRKTCNPRTGSGRAEDGGQSGDNLR